MVFLYQIRDPFEGLRLHEIVHQAGLGETRGIYAYRSMQGFIRIGRTGAETIEETLYHTWNESPRTDPIITHVAIYEIEPLLFGYLPIPDGEDQKAALGQLARRHRETYGLEPLRGVKAPSRWSDYDLFEAMRDLPTIPSSK